MNAAILNRALLASVILWPAAAAATEKPDPVATRILIERLDDQIWRADWVFSSPVTAFRLYPPNLSFRKNAWKLAEAGFSLEETGDGAVVSREGQAFAGFSISFESVSDFDDKTYVPVMPFSGGGAALFSGHFSGDVACEGGWCSSPTEFTVSAREGETALLPEWTSETQPSYIYVGMDQPAEAEQVILVSDQQMPQWLMDTFEQSLPVVTSEFSKRLGQQLTRKPIVLISAGELRDYSGYSVKGGGLDHQFTLMLRGTDLLEYSEGSEKSFQKMIAHELVHVWQQAMPGGDHNGDEPWLHEGSADALAVAGLVDVGVWSEDDRLEFHRGQEKVCRDSLASKTLVEAAAEGDWSAIYACGYLEFSVGVEDSFELFRKLAAESDRRGEPYSQEMLETLR